MDLKSSVILVADSLRIEKSHSVPSVGGGSPDFQRPFLPTDALYAFAS